jgi:hypothetical protein
MGNQIPISSSNPEDHVTGSLQEQEREGWLEKWNFSVQETQDGWEFWCVVKSWRESHWFDYYRIAIKRASTIAVIEKENLVSPGYI